MGAGNRAGGQGWLSGSLQERSSFVLSRGAEVHPCGIVVQLVFAYNYRMKPEFASIDNDLWQWREWFIALASGRFWLLTPLPREFGPFEDFDAALNMVDELVL